MTTLFFVRHSLSDFTHKNNATRPLTTLGVEKLPELVLFFSDELIDAIYSSPYQRTMETVRPIAIDKDLEIIEKYSLRERENPWVEDFETFKEKQWNNFNFKLDDGESLFEVQKRNVETIKDILSKHQNEKVIVGTHGTAFSTIMNYYTDFGMEDFDELKEVMPFVMKVEFKDGVYVSSEIIHR
jgi:2,3-bisphosphoglycerate-dependent phosphoglycerate mutase